MEPRILVLGGTGLLGEPVVRRLRADGLPVRLLTRDLGKASQPFGSADDATLRPAPDAPPDAALEVMEGDAMDPADLRQGLKGCRSVHISIAGPAERVSVELVASLAPEFGLSRIGYVSGSTVDERNRWFPMVEQKLLSEHALRHSGVPWTIFRPTWPFETLARFVRDGRAAMIGKHPTPYHWFAADDFARMVSAAYQSEATAGKCLFIHGPQAIRMHEALDRYRAALHPDIASVSTMPTWLGKLIGTLTRNPMLKFASELMAYFDRVGELGDPTEADRLLGAPTTTLDEWLAARQPPLTRPGSSRSGRSSR